uniref:Uncharacterized protein n=1 Tax=Caenorhabditis japonica TaxID=281687 RepID=A0A8R1IPQ2_CAEJA
MLPSTSAATYKQPRRTCSSLDTACDARNANGVTTDKCPRPIDPDFKADSRETQSNEKERPVKKKKTTSTTRGTASRCDQPRLPTSGH